MATGCLSTSPNCMYASFRSHLTVLGGPSGGDCRNDRASCICVTTLIQPSDCRITPKRNRFNRYDVLLFGLKPAPESPSTRKRSSNPNCSQPGTRSFSSPVGRKSCRSYGSVEIGGDDAGPPMGVIEASEPNAATLSYWASS